jgi:cob(I)alamin adenosyltransferase
MAFEDFKTKEAVVVVYTGEGKGKTSASLGMLARALGRKWRVSYVQFVKTWETGESLFIDQLIASGSFETLSYYRGGKGFYNAGDISAEDVSDDEHRVAAKDTYERAYNDATSGKFELVICDELNNSVLDGLLTVEQLKKLLTDRSPKTSLCITGRGFPDSLLPLTDIATNMTKIKHHFDDKFLANKGIDY